MSQRFLVVLHVTGISIPVENDNPIRGFVTVRRMLASSPEEAGQQAIASLQQEDEYRSLIETTEQHAGSRNKCSVEVDSVGRISWFRWHFSSKSTSYIFYSGDKEEA